MANSFDILGICLKPLVHVIFLRDNIIMIIFLRVEIDLNEKKKLYFIHNSHLITVHVYFHIVGGFHASDG